jgi:hypothetical protein
MLIHRMTQTDTNNKDSARARSEQTTAFFQCCIQCCIQYTQYVACNLTVKMRPKLMRQTQISSSFQWSLKFAQITEKQKNSLKPTSLGNTEHAYNDQEHGSNSPL